MSGYQLGEGGPCVPVKGIVRTGEDQWWAGANCAHFSQVHEEWPHIYSLKLALVEVFTSQKLADATNQGWLVCSKVKDLIFLVLLLLAVCMVDYRNSLKQFSGKLETVTEFRDLFSLQSGWVSAWRNEAKPGLTKPAQASQFPIGSQRSRFPSVLSSNSCTCWEHGQSDIWVSLSS